MSIISTNSSIRHELYRRELLRYIQSMTIVFHPFAEIMERVAATQNCSISSYRENPYYRNLCGEYSCLDVNKDTGQIEKMEVYSIEEERMVPFDKQLWTDYPQTAELYYMGSDAYTRLCLTYPDKVGLIKNIIYPVGSIEEAHDAEELTILRHEPSFLRVNEQESLYAAARRTIKYVRDRWYVYDLGHEDQYYLVFMAQLYMHLFQALLKQRLDNQDTHAVHHMHVWDRLEANGLGPYEAVLNEEQARWFYRNMRYLKENRGRKSNLILLADNILKNLKVHLVGKRIFQQTTDPTQECIEVPEFLSEEIVDYSLQIAESLPETSAAPAAAEAPVAAKAAKSRMAVKSVSTKAKAAVAKAVAAQDQPASTSTLVNTNSMETMDYILSRIYGEGYYPNYSVDDSADREYLFGRTVSNTVPTRLLEFQKYLVQAPYERHMTVFLYDALQLYSASGKLEYSLNFVDQNTGVVVDLSIRDAVALVHYAAYKRFGITPIHMPVKSVLHAVYKMTRPLPSELPSHFHWNGYNYRLDSILNVEGILDDIHWSNNKKFTSAPVFIKHLGEQYQAMVKHIRSMYNIQHFTYNWAMQYLYRFLLDRRTIKIRDDLLYKNWIASTTGVTDLINAYDQLADSKEYYNQLCSTLLEKLLPLEHSEFLMQHAGALFDDSKYYTQLKNLFQDWTSHDLTYLDTDRSQVTFISGLPLPVTTSEHVEAYTTDVTAFSEQAGTHLEEQGYTDLTRDIDVPLLAETIQEDVDAVTLNIGKVDDDFVDMRYANELHSTIHDTTILYGLEDFEDVMASGCLDHSLDIGPATILASGLIDITTGD